MQKARAWRARKDERGIGFSGMQTHTLAAFTVWFKALGGSNYFEELTWLVSCL